MPSGGRLTIRTTFDDGDHVAIRVTDTGTGMTPEVQARVLEPFFTTKPFGAGSGLGLSMVFGFVRQSGGDLRIVSEPGCGTEVTLLLPRAAGAVAAIELAEPYAVAATNGGGELVLLVEDHGDVRQSMRRHLLELGYRVLEAEHGDDACGLLAAVPDIAILLSDVIMPGATDGVALAAYARRTVPGIKIVLTTGFAPVIAGDHDWLDERRLLRKPFGKDELARALAQAAP
jgi:CheY-like chemotaxis protein